jgi:uncharacterized oxidoreductase
MKINGNTVLITGGGTGIGFALAEAFVHAGNKVIICSRSPDHLKQAKSSLPQLHTKRCDVSKENGIKTLYQSIIENFPDTNIVVNNAGIQRMIDFKKGIEDLLKYRSMDGEDEITINLKAYVYLSLYFIPHLMKKKEAAIVNVSSGLGFVPMTVVPIYSATKAAIHSFSMSLRHQLRDTSVKVFEIIPPTVDTNLDQGAREQRGQKDRGIPPHDVATATITGMEKNEYEITIGQSRNIIAGSRNNFEKIFANMNRS